MKAILKASKNCILCDPELSYPFITLLWLFCLLGLILCLKGAQPYPDFFWKVRRTEDKKINEHCVLGINLTFFSKSSL